MILLNLKSYIKKHRSVSLQDIQYHLDIDEQAAIGLLEPLLQQGYIQETNNNIKCSTGSCSKNCHSVSKAASFLWVDKPLKPLAIAVQII